MAQLGVPGKSTITSRHLLRARDGKGVAAGAELAVERAAGSTGAPLPGELRERFESSLGADLSDVRVHTGAESADAASSVGARAYAIGHEIHFAAGAYDPSTADGQFLIAHEVAHTVQQRGGSIQRQHKLEVSGADDPLELEADRAAQAMVAGGLAQVSGGPSVTARKEGDEEGKEGEGDGLSEEDKERLDNAQQLIDKADGCKESATGALSGYAGAAPGALTSLKSTFDANLTMYKRAFDKVNQKITKAKEMEALKEEILTTIVGAALGQLGSVVAALGDAAKESYEAMKAGYDALSAEFGMAFSHAGAAPAAAGGDAAAGVAAPWAKELTFWKAYAGLQDKANGLLPMAVGLVKLAEPIGKVKEAIKGTMSAGKPRDDYPIEKIETDAAKLESGARAFGEAAPGVTGLTTQLQGAVAQASAAIPKSDSDLEKELWVRWAASLGPDKTNVLNVDGIQDYLQSIGVWGLLGINPGLWFSSEEEAIAVCSALAQTKVLEHKGAAVDISAIDGQCEITLPGLPQLNAVVEGTSKVPDRHAPEMKSRAVVIGARAAMQVTVDVLKKAGNSKEVVAEYLLKHQYVTAIVRIFEAVPEGAPKGENDEASDKAAGAASAGGSDTPAPDDESAQ